MPKITYIEHNGTEHQIEAENGDTLMSAALDNMVPGIDADCGGACSCATCHVYIDSAWREAVGARTESEEEMLSMSPDCRENSRLACQIELSDALDGLVVTIPEFQM
ncbi:MAG: (2Fe-2S)-binding protein [Cellvibrionales bacterium]|nr:(2Fe-2S)-binding protein [Cellvibrionales bacterium]